ncbi:hypothetical protein [Helicobacter felis]|nr:hypothetical protein [Helicobacter felis]
MLGYALNFGYQEIMGIMDMQMSEFLAYTELAKEVLEKMHGLK